MWSSMEAANQNRPYLARCTNSLPWHKLASYDLCLPEHFAQSSSSCVYLTNWISQAGPALHPLAGREFRFSSYRHHIHRGARKEALGVAFGGPCVWTYLVKVNIGSTWRQVGKAWGRQKLQKTSREVPFLLRGPCLKAGNAVRTHRLDINKNGFPAARKAKVYSLK